MTGRVIKPVSLPIELNEIVNKHIEKGEFSEYVQECIKRDFTVDYFKKLNARDLEKIRERKKVIKNLQKSTEEDSNEENQEKDKFFKEANKVIKKNPEFLLGQFDRYKNMFEKITLEKFKEKLNDK